MSYLRFSFFFNSVCPKDPSMYVCWSIEWEQGKNKCVEISGVHWQTDVHCEVGRGVSMITSWIQKIYIYESFFLAIDSSFWNSSDGSIFEDEIFKIILVFQCFFSSWYWFECYRDFFKIITVFCFVVFLNLLLELMLNQGLKRLTFVPKLDLFKFIVTIPSVLIRI